MSNNTQPKNRPVAEFADGSLKIAIFENPRKEGDGVRFSGKLTRSYRDAEGQWHETQALSGSEYLRAANLLVQAYNRERELKAEAKANRGGDQ
ncbi:hypothetical protein [Aeoliella sp.]|uniref:hypothetical protein n=1 Tax=Aeoliella sp. TaxID=2795800 RepID=UPI003CCBDD7D